MTLTIVIVAFNAREDLERCLRALGSAPPAVPHDVIVVDNASTDGAPEMVAARFPGVRLVRAPRNVGFAAGNNLGLRECQGDLALLLNPDTVVRPGSIDALVDALRAHPECAAAGPRLIDGSGRAELSFGPLPGPWGELRQKLIGKAHAKGVWPFTRWVEDMTRREGPRDWVSGACLLVRRADADAVGWLDERFFLYWEDVDFCAALRARGRAVWFTPAAEVVHLRGRSSVGVRRAATAAYRRGQLAFYRKWRPRWAPLVAGYLRARGQHPDQAGD